MVRISSTTHFNYDVFLSFRGEDTRYGFTGNLYNAFCKRGINTYLDDPNLRNGDEISPSLLKAIEESRMSVIIFSENYASSTWCLDELVKILKCKGQNNPHVWPIFYKVDPSDVRYQKNSYGRAMTAHEIRFGEDSEKVLNWRSALTKVANLKGDHFRITGNQYESGFIDEIVKKVSITLPPKGLYVGKHVVGLKPCLEQVISLLDISSHHKVCMLGIYGTGGIGKTMLAKTLYNSIVGQFEYACFLFDVRDTLNQDKGLLSLQETLISKMFGMGNVKLSSVDEGAFEIQKRLCNKRVLLVLDDVDHKKQLEKLVGECSWFGLGSRIVMTTRDKHLLLVHQIEKTYEMKELDADKALELFCWKAFHSSHPPTELVDFSYEVVNYVGGLPLALEVIGSNLCDKDLDECICALDQYKRIPNKEIEGILRKSYDSLEKNQKAIFLDIACFFKGYSLEDVKTTWEASGFGPQYQIRVLVNKSLITVSKDGYIGMHDLIQYMGREVVVEVARPGQRSRLWCNENVIKVLEKNLGTSKIEVIMLDSPQQKVQWKGTAFEKMTKLRILIVRNVDFSTGAKCLPNSLTFLEWDRYPSRSLPRNFDCGKLAILKMPNSCLKLRKPLEKVGCLRILDFSHCQHITEVPDMSGVLALQKLEFKGCKNLVKVHDSVGFLTKITYLSFEGCINLTSLPGAFQMTSLERFYISHCTSLQRFPDILGNMDCLTEIYANNTNIKEVPNMSGAPILQKLEFQVVKIWLRFMILLDFSLR